MQSFRPKSIISTALGTILLGWVYMCIWFIELYIGQGCPQKKSRAVFRTLGTIL